MRLISTTVVALSITVFLSGGTGDAYAQLQDVCTGTPTGVDVFSVGEVRTSILAQTPFQEINGSEWVLMDGRPLLVQTALSPHLTEDSQDGPIIPDARGRFLRMANNSVCAEVRTDDAAYRECTASHDPDGDRFLGEYQADATTLTRHSHEHGDVFWSESNANYDIAGDGHYNNIGSGQRWDFDNNGHDSRRRTSETGGDDGESRPKNIAVNFYIKICDCRTENCR